MPLPIPQSQLEALRKRDVRTYELLKSIIDGVNTVQQQTGTDASQSNPAAPPAVNGVDVTGQNGYLHVAITDQNQIYRGINYFAEHADNPQFTNPQIVPMGSARNTTIPVGNQSRYVRVYSAYPFAPPSAPVYHGGLIPAPVNGGGADAGPAFLPSQGSGTGATGVGLSGPGKAPYRTSNGAPPTR